MTHSNLKIVETRRAVRLASVTGCMWLSLAGAAGAAAIERSGDTISVTSPGDGAEVISADLDAGRSTSRDRGDQLDAYAGGERSAYAR